MNNRMLIAGTAAAIATGWTLWWSIGKIIADYWFDSAYTRPVVEILSKTQKTTSLSGPIPTYVLIKTSEDFEKKYGQPNWACEFILAMWGSEWRLRLLQKLEENKQKLGNSEEEKETINLLIQKIKENNNQDWFEKNFIMLIGFFVWVWITWVTSALVVLKKHSKN